MSSGGLRDANAKLSTRAGSKRSSCISRAEPGGVAQTGHGRALVWCRSRSLSASTTPDDRGYDALVSAAKTPVRGRTIAPRQEAEGQPPAWASPSGLLLITSLLVGGFALLSSEIVLARPLTNSIEWALFVLTLTVLTPAAIALGRWLAQMVHAVAGSSGLAELAALAAVGILGAVIAARGAYALGHRSSTVLLVLALVWSAALVWGARRLTHAKRLIPAAWPSWAAGWPIRAGLRRG